MNIDELEPRKPIAKPSDLGALSVEELKTYIQELEGEIERAKSAIEAKTKHRAGADALFKR
ncbi:conserved hypothetical protein [Rhodospirillaceae bacterium LM-1]|nr:conserved hypothetical protein [Rhodospirillaceae bacterium LM-1]